MPSLEHLIGTFFDTVWDVMPIVVILLFFQVVVIRRLPSHLKRLLTGFVLVVVGLAFFLVGLEQALFPLGETMARQLTAADFTGQDPTAEVDWTRYIWVYAFAAAIGFATTVAEPALIAVSLKAQTVSGQALNAWGLRLAVAFGVAVGVSLGTLRIVTGTPLPYYIMAGYLIVILQTWRANRSIVPLAYDSGGVTTSTVTVPVVTALGLGLAESVPGRSPLIDGFGLIAFASVCPIMAVLGYQQFTDWRRSRLKKHQQGDKTCN